MCLHKHEIDLKNSSRFPGNIHCGYVPPLTNMKRESLNAFIKYWGYETPERVQNKNEFYATCDPGAVARNVERMNAATAPWRDALDANDIGKRSVNY